MTVSYRRQTVFVFLAPQVSGLFVWIVSAMTVTKVVEGCVYIRRRYHGFLPRVGGEFEHSALSPISLALSSNATTLNHLIRLRGSQGIQIWKQRTGVAAAGGLRPVWGTDVPFRPREKGVAYTDSLG